MTQNVNPLVSIAILKSAPGQRENLRAALLDLIEPTRAEPDNLDYVLFERNDAPGVFYMRESFTNGLGLERHRQTQHFQTFVTRSTELLRAPIQLEFLTRISN